MAAAWTSAHHPAGRRRASCSESFTSIGVGMPSSTEGMKNISVVIHSTWRIAGQDVGAGEGVDVAGEEQDQRRAAAAPR